MFLDLCQNGRRALSSPSLTRHALLIGTILGAGILIAPAARAADQIINVTTSGGHVSTTAVGTDGITVNQSPGATINGGATFDGIYTNTVDGNINLGGTAGLQSNISGVSGVTALVDGAGSIAIKTVAGGTITGTVGRGVLTRAQSGTTTIDLGANVTAAGEGIDAASTGGNINITTAAGTIVSGGTGGIVTNSGSGNTSITMNGDVLSGIGSAIWARSTTGNISIDGAGTAGQTSNPAGAGGGIAVSTTTGAITVRGSGNTSGQGGALVNLQITDSNSYNDISLMRSGSYTVANGAAIYANNQGTGRVVLANLGAITATGTWDSVGGFPTAAVVAKANGAINIGGDSGLSNAVTSDQAGIYAETTGISDINIHTVAGGSITARHGVGLQTLAVDGTTNIDIGADISGSTQGISARASGTGTINIDTASGTTITGLATGILAEASGGDINIGIVNNGGLLGAVSGGTGIDARTTGDGQIQIRTSTNGATVTGTSGQGIRTRAQNGTTSIAVGSNVTGATYGIEATSTSGFISISTTAGSTVSGGTNGIVTNSDSGSTNITADSAVQSAQGTGIYATSTSGAITIEGTGTISSSNANNQFGAIYAGTSSGAIRLRGSGNVSSNGDNAVSLSITDSGSNADIIITRSGTYTAKNGAAIVATNYGAGAINISGLGTVTATGSWSTNDITGAAIAAIASGGNINIGGTSGLANNIVSDLNGIYAETSGTGTITIKTAEGGSIQARNGNGIYVTADNGATNITIGAGSTVTGTINAIKVATTNGNVTVTNTGAVKGSLTFTKTGTGTGTFNNSGTLELTSAQSNSGFTINNQSGGVLKGLGSFGAINAASGSTILAGDRSIAIASSTTSQRIFTASSLTLSSGAVVDVRADYSGVSDKVAVSGTAALNGATLKITATPKVDATWSDGKTFTILTATSVTGTFATTSLDYAFLKATLTYNAASVDMKLDRNWTSFGTYASSSNQKSVSDVFDKFQTQTTNPVINRVTTLTVAQAPVALSQLSGTGLVATRTQAVGAKAAFTGAINSEMGKFTSSSGGGSSPLSYAEDTSIKSKAFDKIAPKKPEPIPDGRIWAQMLGGWGEMRADNASGSPSERSNNYGLAAGADTALNANLRAGFALSLGQSTTKVSSLATSSESTWGQGALYAVATDGDDYLKGVLTYGYLDNKTDRTVTAFGTSDKAKGKFGANLVSLRLEAGHKVAFDPLALTPFVAFEPSILFQNAYNETGPASITLGFDKTTTRALPATLGVKADADYELGDLRMTPSATIGWVHDFAQSSSISPFFTALPGSNFTAQGAKGDRNLARTELNFEATPKGTLATFYVNARADLGARTTSVRGMAGVSLRF